MDIRESIAIDMNILENLDIDINKRVLPKFYIDKILY